MVQGKKNSKEKMQIKSESKRHEDKIANLLKSMKERKDRKRLSLEDRLLRMETLVKKQEKVGLAKKKSLRTVNADVKFGNNHSMKKSKREKVPTAKFIEYQKKNSKSSVPLDKEKHVEVKREKDQSTKNVPAKNVTPKKTSNPKEKVGAGRGETPAKKKVIPTPQSQKINVSTADQRSPRVRVQTQKFLDYKNEASRESLKSSASDDVKNSKSVELKTSSERQLVEEEKLRKTYGFAKETSIRKAVPNKPSDEKVVPKSTGEGTKTHITLKRSLEATSEVGSNSRTRDRVRVPTSKFLEYQKSLTEENEEKKVDSPVEIKATKNDSKTVVKSKPPVRPLTVKPAQSSGSDLDSRQRMMDEILNAHYAKMKPSSPSVTNTNPLHGSRPQPEIHRNVSEPVKSVPESPRADNYIYIKVDDEISIKSPVRPSPSFARFVAGGKVTDQEKRKLETDLSMTPVKPKQPTTVTEKKIMSELSRYQRIAPKGSEVRSFKENLATQGLPCYIPCHLCDYVAMSMTGFEQHVQKRHPNARPVTEFFHFPNFLGFNCSLRNSRFQLIPYYVTEVTQPQKNGLFPMPENLSQTCLFFIPQRTLGQFSELKNCTNIYIPYQSHSRGFSAHFPNTPNLQVSWATNISSAELCVGQLEMFILTKSRFKLIQSVRSGRDKQGGPGTGGGYGGFCQFTDQEKIQLESAIRMQTTPMLQSMAPTTQETSPQVVIDVYRCPFPGCDFVSDRKFSGIRNHFLKHFKEQIEREAKPRAFLTEREKSNCMSKTGCSVAVLTARGELVHHFGIFHCLVDDLFQEYAFRWFRDNHPDYYFKNRCPYCDYIYKDEKDFLEHLSSVHYFNAILSEVEDMVKFSLTYFEEYKCMANMYKCPFCKKKFKNLADGSNVRDVKEMVLHCGVEHGFALYYLMSDKKIDEMRKLLRSINIKEEPLDCDDDSNNQLGFDLQNVKLEPVEETETEINNFLEVEMHESEDV